MKLGAAPNVLSLSNAITGLRWRSQQPQGAEAQVWTAPGCTQWDAAHVPGCSHVFTWICTNLTVCTFILLTESLQLLCEAVAWVHLYELRLPRDELSSQPHGLADSEDL